METDLIGSFDCGYHVESDPLAMAYFVTELERDGYVVTVSKTSTGSFLIEWQRGY